MTRSKITGGLLRDRMDINRDATIPAGLALCESTGRIDAFRLEWRPGDPNPPHIFWDSDLAKWLEAAALSLADSPDPALESRVREIASLVASAQQPDGYLNTHFTLVEPDKRFTNLRDCHELYCAGHIFEAAAAVAGATGDTTLLEAARRYAALIARTFGRGPGMKRGIPGHEEIELALVKLYEATGGTSLFDLAKYFIDERGASPHYFAQEAEARGEAVPADATSAAFSYCQSHKPVREQDRLVGHAVRAAYLYCGMADVARISGDEALAAACRRLWRHATRTQMSVTGGLGQTCACEGFTQDYDLPDESAYLETCAAIGLAFWATRMTRLEPLGEYADVFERALYNGILSGVSADGTRFFYGNPLAAQPGFDGNGRYQGEGYHYRRQQWFDCACCPPNAARFIAQLPSFLADARGDTLFIHHYAESRIEAEIGGGAVALDVATRYPWDGEIAFSLASCGIPHPFAIALRIPGWCRGATVRINGAPLDIGTVVRDGYAYVMREWREGDTIALSLPMPVEPVAAHPLARQTAGRIAIMRGPVVYCAESADQPDIPLAGVHIARPLSCRIEESGDGPLRGAPLIRALAYAPSSEGWEDALYRPASETTSDREFELTTIPYFLWGNRAPGAMRVWLRHSD